MYKPDSGTFSALHRSRGSSSWDSYRRAAGGQSTVDVAQTVPVVVVPDARQVPSLEVEVAAEEAGVEVPDNPAGQSLPWFRPVDLFDRRVGPADVQTWAGSGGRDFRQRRRQGTELPVPRPHLICHPCTACSTSSGGSCAGCTSPSGRTASGTCSTGRASRRCAGACAPSGGACAWTLSDTRGICRDVGL